MDSETLWLIVSVLLGGPLATVGTLLLHKLLRVAKVDEKSRLWAVANDLAREVVRAADEWGRKKAGRVTGQEKLATAKAEFDKIAPKEVKKSLSTEKIDLLIASKVNELRPSLAQSASIAPGARASLSPPDGSVSVELDFPGAPRVPKDA